jgi:hypothetical protein
VTLMMGKSYASQDHIIYSLKNELVGTPGSKLTEIPTMLSVLKSYPDIVTRNIK